MSKKLCKICGIEKPFEDFPKDKSNWTGRYSYCRECHKAKSLKYYYDNIDEQREKRKLFSKQYCKKNPEKRRNTLLKNKYKITTEDFLKIHSSQNGCCAICNISEENFGKFLSVDHEHSSGKVRGLLCQKCNLLLGNAKDSIDILIKAIEYLGKHNGQ